MSAAAWFASMMLIAFAGLWSWRLCGGCDIAARVSLAFAFGLVTTGALMFVEAIAGMQWSSASIAVPGVAIGLVGVMRIAQPERRIPLRSAWPIIPVAALLIYGTCSARMTIGDLLYFWGPKAQHFFHARTIDVEFLKFPHYYLMHPDYPPLLPLVSAACAIFTESFSWWGMLLWTPAALIAAALIVRSFAAETIGDRAATAFATLLVAVLTLAGTSGLVAGGADALLVLFEVIAVASLTFSRGKASTAIAAAALAGAVFTKVEGAPFAVTVVIALLLTRRFREAAVVAIPAVIFVGSWIAFARHHGLLDAYARGERHFHVENIALVFGIAIRKLSYEAFYLPWLAAAAPLLFAQSFRRAAFPLLVALGSFAYSILFYMNEAQPAWWILASVERVMMTTLACLVVASAAASEYSPARDGLVPQGEKTEGSGGEADRDSGGPVDQVR